MAQVLHQRDTTAHATRSEIQRSMDSVATLSCRYGIKPKSVLKWLNPLTRGSFAQPVRLDRLSEGMVYISYPKLVIKRSGITFYGQTVAHFPVLRLNFMVLAGLTILKHKANSVYL